MNNPISIKFIFVLFFLVGLSLSSQNERKTQGFTRGKDVFGTRVFIENKKQFDNTLKSGDKIYYALENGSEKIYFTNKGLVYKLVKKQRITHEMHEAMEHGEKVETKADEIYFVTMTWANANTGILIEGSNPLNHYLTYGGPELNSKTYKKITYKNVYNGIDFEYTIPENKEHGIKYNVIIHPGADPTDIKMIYSGDVEKITSNKAGDIIIKTPLDDITEHAPATFYNNNQPVASAFSLNKNTLSFNFPNGYENSKTLIIDPWITTITNFTANNFGFDVDYDFAGNVFVYGGNAPFKISMYNPTGILQWTFSGTLTSPNWTTGTYPGNFVVNKSTGKCYIGIGYDYYGTTTIRISNNGNYDNFITTANPNWNECWDMGFHCVTGNIYAFGGGQSGNLAAGIIDQVTASVLPTAFFPNNPIHGQDIASHAIDDQGNVFVYYSQGTNLSYLLNNRVVLLNPALTGVVWNQSSTYTTLSECQNKNSFWGAGNSTGFNCLAVNSNYLFFYDGFNLAAYSKTTGAKIASTTITNHAPMEQGGIAVDDCNNIYVGGKNCILSYNFIDTAFIANTNISFSNSLTPKYVYDIRLERASGLLYVSGTGFVGTFNALPCQGNGSSTTNNIKVCKGATLQLYTPLSSSYSWNGPDGFTSNIQNPFLTNVSALMAGTYSVITAPSFCSSSTLAITNVTVDSINVHLTANPNYGFAPLIVEFENTTVLQNKITGIINTTWNYGNGISKTNTGTSAGYSFNGFPKGNTIYQSAGSYTVYLILSQKNGTVTCAGTASTVINVELPSKTETPNTFSPNGDGVNENFILLTTNITGITCTIYDRWGVKMYDVKAEKGNISWDGKNFSGKDVPAGTYFYILSAEGKDAKTAWVDEKGKEIKQQGTISLFR